MIERLPATASTQIVHIVFRDGGEIWRLPCRSGSYAMQFIVAYRVDGNLQRLTQPYRHIGIEPRPLLLEQAEFAVLPGHAIGAAISPAVASAPTSPGAAGLFFLSAHEANQPAACRTTWIWNGRWMDRIEQTCSIGKEAGQFDVILSRERAVPGD